MGKRHKMTMDEYKRLEGRQIACSLVASLNSCFNPIFYEYVVNDVRFSFEIWVHERGKYAWYDRVYQLLTRIKYIVVWILLGRNPR